MGTQKEIAKTIIGKKADYVLSVKKNQPQMHEDIRYFIEEEEKNQFKGVAHEYFRTLDNGHWGIEAVHWTLDVVLNEDKRTVRKDNGAQNLAVLKRMALNILRADAFSDKMTGPQKCFRACWDTQYMTTVLRNM